MSQLELLTHLFDALPLGLIVIDASSRIVVYNRAEERMAGRSRSAVMGSKFFEQVAPCMDVRELGGQFRERIGKSPLDETVEMSFPFAHHDQPRDVKVRLSSFVVGGAPYGFLIIEDTSLHRQIERMREQLQSLLVHDLKNPLAAATMNLQLLEETPSVRDSPDAMEFVEQAMASTGRLARMTVDLLDISRLETDSMPLRRTNVDLGQLFARVVNDNRTVARASEATIHAMKGAPASVFIDEDLVVRALDNLVENAVRFARNVFLTAKVERNELTITVRDDGPGIPAEVRESLFDKFVQVTGSGEAARGQNRGLGLTFVRLVARQHGGDANVTCPSGGGSVFSLTLQLP
ncbi:MAG TPA: ATP-binding protein [Kofleriaceae bacterium]